MGAERRDPMGRLRLRPERGERQIADIKIAIELSPGPAFIVVIDGDGFAVERLGLQRRVRRGETPQRRGRLDDLHGKTLRIAGRVDESSQASRREVGAGGGDARVERGHGRSLAGYSRCPSRPPSLPANKFPL